MKIITFVLGLTIITRDNDTFLYKKGYYNCFLIVFIMFNALYYLKVTFNLFAISKIVSHSFHS